MRREGNQGGFVATELALGIGVLLLPVVVVVLTIPTWSERQTTARAIAREVARLVAREGFCDQSAAHGLAELMAANLALDRGDVQLELDCVSNAALAPGDDVQASVTVAMPALALPTLGSVGAWSWTARNRQPVDLYGSVP